MAISDYHCETCGISFEFIKIRSNDTVQCPKCEESRPDKLIRSEIHTGGSFALKGSGWARDRYNGGGRKRSK